MRPIYIAGAICAALLPQVTLADDAITVYGTRLEQTLHETGTAITVITGEELELLGYDFLFDALAAAPGVTINQTGALGGAASVRIRGAGSEQTLVLIDGVVVNDPSTPGGGYDFARLDPADIERIEILRGPQSTLWGTDAIGGVVSIVTKRAAEGLSISGFAEYGSFDTGRGGAALTYGGARGNFRLGVVGTDSAGFSKADEDNGNTEEDGYEALTVSASGEFLISDDIRLRGSASWNDATTDFDSFVFGDQGNVGDGDEHSEVESFTGTAVLDATTLNGRLNHQLTFGHSEITRDSFFMGAPSFSAEGRRTTIRYLGRADVNQYLQFAAGVEHEISEASGEEVGITGAFGLVEISPTNALTLTGGLRLDDHEVFGEEVTARAAAAFNPNPQWTLRASWGQGFKAPTLFQSTFFCCGALGPNPDLAAETSDAFDAGVDWRAPDGRTLASVTFFHQDIENLIDFDMGTYFNIAQVESEGIEVEASHAITNWLTAQLTYSYLNSRDGGGARLSRVPQHSGGLTLTFDPQGPWSGALLVRHNGEEPNTDGTMLADWTRVDLSATFAMANGVEMYGRVENLLDTDYQQVIGYGTADRSASLGVRVRY